MAYLLDTDTISYALRGQGGVAERLMSTSPEDVFASSVSEAELWYGMEKRRSKKLAGLIRDFLQPLTVLPFDRDAARRFGSLHAELERRGQPIGALDAMLAAVALARSLILVPHNVRHFGRVDGLVTEDWL